MKVRRLTMKDVEVAVRAEPEDAPVRGNALASGDETVGREAEDAVIAALEAGNEWAWCRAVVEVSWGNFRGVASLGCCSYHSEDDFRKGGYYEEMVSEALSDLNDGIARIYAEVCPLLE